MSILDTIKEAFKFPHREGIQQQSQQQARRKSEIDAFNMFNGFSTFDGETDFMEFGDTHSYQMDYYTLRERSWQLYAENEIVKTIITRLKIFTIGTGLKMQATPNEEVLKHFKVGLDFGKWTSQVEAFWKTYSDSKHIDYKKEKCFGSLEGEVFLNTLVGGDCLIIERLDEENKWLGYQIIDGAYIRTPNVTIKEAEGRKIVDGVEIDNKGRHVAYYVLTSALNNDTKVAIGAITDYKRILATSRTTRRRKAWLVYGNQYRSNEVRGMPLVAVCMQKAKQIDRYSKAELCSAEMNAKFIATIEHNELSTGENPLKKTKLASSRNRPIDESGGYYDTGYSTLSGDEIAKNLSRGINGTITNLGIGQKFKSNDTQRQTVNYTNFYDNVVKYLCSACEIPYEVALMVFGKSFSASRASTKMFEEILSVKRKDFYNQFSKRAYESFVIYYTALGYIDSASLLQDIADKTTIKVEAYLQVRFFGKPIPHIDPLKEVQASIMKIDNGLSSRTKETEILGTGDFEENIKQIQKEDAVFTPREMTSQTERQNFDDDDEDDEEDDENEKKERKNGKA